MCTGYEPEPIPSARGGTETPARGYAIALALAEWTPHAEMQVVYETAGFDAGECVSLRDFALGMSRLDAEPCQLRLSTGGSLTIERVAQSRRIAA